MRRLKKSKGLKFEGLLNPPYSSDLATLGFRVFGTLKVELSGRKFVSVEEVPEAVHERLCKTLFFFFQEGLRF